jgi:hypothetical protein
LPRAQREAAAQLITEVYKALQTARNDRRVLIDTVDDVELVLRGLADSLGALCADLDAKELKAQAQAVTERLLARRLELEGVENR